MIGQFAQKKMLPAAVGFYPSEDTEAAASSAGVSISSQDVEPDETGEDINAFWRPIVDALKAKTNESGAEATMKDVKEAYLARVKETDP
jgi:hypothetical protein